MLLFHPWTGPPIDDKVIESEFRLGKLLIQEDMKDSPGEKYVKVSSLEVEMQIIGMEQVLMDLFRHLLVVDPNKRPSVDEALKSREYLALKRPLLRAHRLRANITRYHDICALLFRRVYPLRHIDASPDSHT